MNMCFVFSHNSKFYWKSSLCIIKQLSLAISKHLDDSKMTVLLFSKFSCPVSPVELRHFHQNRHGLVNLSTELFFFLNMVVKETFSTKREVFLSLIKLASQSQQ